MRQDKVSLCAVPRCSPNHIRANESIPPPVMAAPTRGPGKEYEGTRKGVGGSGMREKKIIEQKMEGGVRKSHRLGSSSNE